MEKPLEMQGKKCAVQWRQTAAATTNSKPICEKNESLYSETLCILYIQTIIHMVEMTNDKQCSDDNDNAIKQKKTSKQELEIGNKS